MHGYSEVVPALLSPSARQSSEQRINGLDHLQSLQLLSRGERQHTALAMSGSDPDAKRHDMLVV